MSRFMRQSILGLSRMGTPSDGLRPWKCWARSMILVHQGPLSCRVRLPAGSDNQGNVMQPWVQETAHSGYLDGIGAPAPHAYVPREFNQWAEVFDLLNRVPKQELCSDFVFLPRLLNGDAFDLSVLFLHDLDPGGGATGPTQPGVSFRGR